MKHSGRYAKHIAQSKQNGISIFEGLRFNTYDRHGVYKYSLTFMQICNRVFDGRAAVFGYNKTFFGMPSHRNNYRSDMRLYNSYYKIFDEIVILGARDFDFFKELYIEYMGV